MKIPGPYSLNSSNIGLAVPPHKYHPAPSPVPVGFAAHLEGMKMSYGWLLSRKISSNVLFDGHGAVQVGHDIGLFVPHYNVFPPAPPNLLLLSIIPSSSFMTTFSKLNVLVNGKPAGSYHVYQPQLVCADPTARMPLGFVVDAPLCNTVVFSFTWADFIGGLAVMAFNWGLAFAFSRLFQAKFMQNLAHKAFQWFGHRVGASISQRVGNLLGQRFLGGRVGRLLMGRAKNLSEYMAQGTNTLTTFIDEVALGHAVQHGTMGIIERSLEVKTHGALHGAEDWARDQAAEVGRSFDPELAASDRAGSQDLSDGPHTDIVNSAPLVGEPAH